MLEELPDSITGLGASEMDLLDFVNDGHTDPRLVEHARWVRNVFDKNDAGDALLDLGEHSVPPVLLGDPAFDNEDRYFGRSEWKVTLTELGRSLLAREDDMWRHNPNVGGAVLNSPTNGSGDGIAEADCWLNLRYVFRFVGWISPATAQSAVRTA